MSSHVAVIDYGMGNLHSVAKALEHAGARQVDVTSDPQIILAADRVLLPGVGAIRDCVSELRQLELDGVVRQAAREKPLLGICVGMQMLLEHSEENGGVDCLGLFPGKVRFFGNELHEADGEVEEVGKALPRREQLVEAERQKPVPPVGEGQDRVLGRGLYMYDR